MSADTTPRHVRTYVMKHQGSMHQMASLAWAAMLAAKTPSVEKSMIEKHGISSFRLLLP
jgi:hypothetical protein